MASALPIAKLAGLLVKTLAKPVSKRIKHEFNRTAATRQLLHVIGQTSHQVTSRLTIWSAGYKVRQVTPLDSDEAMKIGSEFVGESFVLIVSSATVLWEYNRSKAKDEKKAALKLQKASEERQALQEQLHAINVRLLALESAEIMEGHRNRTVGGGGGGGSTASLWNPLWMGSTTKRQVVPSTPTPINTTTTPKETIVSAVEIYKKDSVQLSKTTAPVSERRKPPGSEVVSSSPTTDTQTESASPNNAVSSKWWNLWGLWSTSERGD